MKYAIVESGGKQYKAVEGQSIVVDRLEAEAGEEIVLNDVLLLVSDGAVKVGQPTVKAAKVTGKIVGEEKGPKIIVSNIVRRNIIASRLVTARFIRVFRSNQ